MAVTVLVRKPALRPQQLLAVILSFCTEARGLSLDPEGSESAEAEHVARRLRMQQSIVHSSMADSSRS